MADSLLMSPTESRSFLHKPSGPIFSSNSNAGPLPNPTGFLYGPASAFLDLGTLGALESFREGGAAASRAARDSLLGIDYQLMFR